MVLDVRNMQRYLRFAALSLRATLLNIPYRIFRLLFTVFWVIWSSIFTIIAAVTWAFLCDTHRSDLPDFIFINDPIFTGVLTSVMTFTVVGVLQRNLSKHNHTMERFNAFSGQCYDFAVLLHTFKVSKKPPSNPQGRTMFEDTIEMTSLIPLVVKHEFRGDYDVNKIKDKCFTKNCRHSVDNLHDDPFLGLMRQINSLLETLKDDQFLTLEEWQECQVRLSSIYGPWGDLSTLRAYSQPEIIKSLLEISLYLWYLFTIPLLVDVYGHNGIWATLVINIFFNGFYIMSNHIRNPFQSSKSSPYLYKSSETASDTVNSTIKAIQSLSKEKPLLRRFTTQKHLLMTRFGPENDQRKGI